MSERGPEPCESFLSRRGLACGHRLAMARGASPIPAGAGPVRLRASWSGGPAPAAAGRIISSIRPQAASAPLRSPRARASSPCSRTIASSIEVVGLAAGGLDGARGQTVGRGAVSRSRRDAVCTRGRPARAGPAAPPRPAAGRWPGRRAAAAPGASARPAGRGRSSAGPTWLDSPEASAFSADRDRDREVVGMRLAELLQGLIERGELLRIAGGQRLGQEAPQPSPCPGRAGRPASPGRAPGRGPSPWSTSPDPWRTPVPVVGSRPRPGGRRSGPARRHSGRRGPPRGPRGAGWGTAAGSESSSPAIGGESARRGRSPR